jgi:hypothetical protein
MKTMRRQLVAVVSLSAVAAALAACGLPVAGGFVAGLVAVLALVFGAVSLTTLAGCDSKTVGPCLSLDRSGERDMRVGPCLSPPMQLDGRRDLSVGPCLQPMPLDGGRDVRVGPCLDPIPPEVGPCLKIAPDLGQKDIHVGPCLSPPMNDAAQSRLDDPSPSRDEVIDRLRAAGVISEEQATRMKRLPG